MIKHQFFSNLSYKNNWIDEKNIKYVKEDEKEGKNNEYICKRLFMNGLVKRENEEMTETTISNKPKYLNKLNNYKTIKLKVNQ